MPKEGQVRLSVQMPDDLRQAVKRCSANDRRRVSDWVRLRLEAAVAAANAQAHDAVMGHLIASHPSRAAVPENQPMPKVKRRSQSA